MIGIAGGVGATTLAVNLAWELANARKGTGEKICLIDLDLQRGAIGSYMNLPPHRGLLEAWDGSGLVAHHLGRCTQTTQSGMFVITAPAELVPADLLREACVESLITFSRATHDVTIIDMPGLIPRWIDRVLHSSDCIFVVSAPEVRSARQLTKLLSALRAEGVSAPRMTFIENKSPAWTSPIRKWTAKRLREALGISYAALIRDYGSKISIANDQGLPVSLAFQGHPFGRKVKALLGASEIFAPSPRI